MPSPLTRQEQMLVAFVLLSFCAGMGIKHWREKQTLAPWQAEVSQHR